MYLEPKWPLFLKVNPSKQSLFKPKQGSFGFQVYIYIYLDDGFNYFFMFTPTCGNDPIWRADFFNWFNHQLDIYIYIIYTICTYRFWKPQLEMLEAWQNNPPWDVFFTFLQREDHERAPWADSTWASTGSETSLGVLRFVETHFCGVIVWPIWTYLANMPKRLKRFWDCIWM